MQYFVRVELYGCDDYDPLHEALEQIGFVRTGFVQGQEQELPPGTYVHNPANPLAALAYSAEEIEQKVINAIRSVWPEPYFGVLLFQASKALAYGLRPVGQHHQYRAALAKALLNPGVHS